MGRSIVSFIAHPIFMLAVVFAQLILGALLGIQLTNIDFNSLENTEFREWLVVSWSNINGNVQIFIISVFVLSIVKAICDAIKAYLTRIHEKEKLKRASLIPSNQWFSSSYLDTVRDVLNDRYMIDNGQKAPLKVIQDSLTKLRNLASEYDYLSTDTISINLMIVMRADESKKLLKRIGINVVCSLTALTPNQLFRKLMGYLPQWPLRTRIRTLSCISEKIDQKIIRFSFQ